MATGGMLTRALQQRWDEDGWCVMEGAIPAADLAAAQEAAQHLFPTAEEMARGDGGTSTAPWRTWDAQWPEFPFLSPRLNALVVHDEVITVAEELLGTPEITLYMGIISAKYAGQSSGYNQLLHTDYPNHMLVVPRRDVGYQQVEFFIYLTDVGLEDGATRFVSRRRTSEIPVERHTLSYLDYAELYDDAGHAAAPAGSIVAYSPDVYHRSVDVSDPTRRRLMMHVGFKPRHAEWGGYQAWPFKGFSTELRNFVQQATPRQLAVFGIPAPGHPYWTDETLAGVSARYPGLDMSPWRAAAAGR
jgi:ectoine hydroxylase-related dioxygenase (phytanoyl-CoA dioxygenase family)